MAVDDGNLYWTDLLVLTVTARSYSLVDGFLAAFDAWNPVVAAPIVRMQLDSLIRIAYAAEVNTDELTKYVVEGGELRRRKDSEGKLLTDRRLVELAAEAHPWLKGVYEASSGWVHLSPDLLHAVVEFSNRAENEGDPPEMWVGVGIPIRRERIPLQALEELIGAMTQATEEIFGYIEAWESRKGLPVGQVRDLGPD